MRAPKTDKTLRRRAAVVKRLVDAACESHDKPGLDRIMRTAFLEHLNRIMFGGGRQ